MPRKTTTTPNVRDGSKTPVAEFESRSSRGKWHTVLSYDDGGLSCGCHAWIFARGENKTCKHTDAYAQYKRTGMIGYVEREGGRLITGGVAIPGKKDRVYNKLDEMACDKCGFVHGDGGCII